MSALSKRSMSFLVCLAAYAAAGIAAFAVARVAPPNRLILAALLADLAATVVVFGFSVAFDNSSMYDPYWSVGPRGDRRLLASAGSPGRRACPADSRDRARAHLGHQADGELPPALAGTRAGRLALC